MEKENILIQFLTSVISGGIIVLLAFLIRKAKNTKIRLDKKFGVILLLLLILISVFILTR